MTSETDDLLKVMINVLGRSIMGGDELRTIVAAGKDSGSEKQIAAYNLCDGTRAQGAIAKMLSIDAGNFSRTVSRWEKLGVVFRIGDEQRLLHLYPLP